MHWIANVVWSAAVPQTPEAIHCHDDLVAAFALSERNYPGYNDRVSRFSLPIGTHLSI